MITNVVFQFSPGSQNFLEIHVCFPKTSRSAKTKFQHLETQWRAENSALHHIVSNKTSAKYFDRITKQPYDAETPDVENKRWILNV